MKMRLDTNNSNKRFVFNYMIKRKKIYYVPGLISLFFLPVLLVLKDNHEINRTKQFSIEYLTLLESDKKYYDYEIPAKRDFINVKIDDNTKNDSLRFIFIKNFAQSLDQSKDTVIGLKIIFNNTIKYATFIETLNSLLKAKCQTYIPIEDTLFVYYMNRTDSCPKCNIPNDWACHKRIELIDDVIIVQERQKELWLERKNNFIFHMHYWPIFFIYSVLVILSIKKL